MITKEDIMIQSWAVRTSELMTSGKKDYIFSSLDISFYLFKIIDCNVTLYKHITDEDAIKEEIIKLFKDKCKP